MATTFARCSLWFEFKISLSISLIEKHLPNGRIWILLNIFMLISGWMDISRKVIASVWWAYYLASFLHSTDDSNHFLIISCAFQEPISYKLWWHPQTRWGWNFLQACRSLPEDFTLYTVLNHRAMFSVNKKNWFLCLHEMKIFSVWI